MTVKNKTNLKKNSTIKILTRHVEKKIVKTFIWHIDFRFWLFARKSIQNPVNSNGNKITLQFIIVWTKRLESFFFHTFFKISFASFISQALSQTNLSQIVKIWNQYVKWKSWQFFFPHGVWVFLSSSFSLNLFCFYSHVQVNPQKRICWNVRLETIFCLTKIIKFFFKWYIFEWSISELQCSIWYFGQQRDFAP